MMQKTFGNRLQKYTFILNGHKKKQKIISNSCKQVLCNCLTFAKDWFILYEEEKISSECIVICKSSGMGFGDNTW